MHGPTPRATQALTGEARIAIQTIRRGPAVEKKLAGKMTLITRGSPGVREPP
jgi:hypothetical protein